VDDNILQDLACEARKEIIPRFSRAKNVDNKWVYLAQLGHREFQEVEVIICRHPEQKCVNGVVHQIKHPIPESTNSLSFYTKLSVFSNELITILTCGTSHIRSVLIGVKYQNCCQTLDVYLLVAILIGLIQSKLDYKLVNPIPSSPFVISPLSNYDN
jgi:hypothetical protein